jgi:hypothetical protein
LAAVAGSAGAAEQKMTGAEIRAALTGNSVRGFWGQTEYKSFFDVDGSTIYHAKGRDPDRGRWRATDTQYCSTWRDTESCYDLYRNGDMIIWLVPESGARYPSTLVRGEDTSF